MNIFEKKYKEDGFESQRKYPNESLIAFASGLSKKARVLDLGCGSGANTWFLAKEGFKTFGIDFAETGIDLCYKMLKKWNVNAILTVGDMIKLPYPDNFFHAVVDVVSMQHLTLKEHEKCIKEVLRVLKPGGKFFSYHLCDIAKIGEHFSADMIDICTVKDIPQGWPLANNGQTCFLSPEIAKALLNNFTNFSLETVRRSYDERRTFIDYLVIKAEK